jgi:tetratricopeptide (TPR) repeat protein
VYICGDCVLLSLGALAAGFSTPLEPGDAATVSGERARQTAFDALGSILDALPTSLPHAQIEPLLVSMLHLSPARGSTRAVSEHAVRRSHYEFALRALTTIAPSERTAAIWHDIAALSIELEFFDDARDALDAARGPEADDLFARCHRARLASHVKEPLSEDELAELVARVRETDNNDLKGEALEALARHRSTLGDISGAREALDEALALCRKPGLLLVQGDLLAEADRDAATRAWEEVLSGAHPDSVVARRARERLSPGHPYRSR